MDESRIRRHPEGENYFVSMTDMMIGLVFIFIIMLMYFALQASKQSDEASQQKDVASLERMRAEQVRLDAQRERANNETTRLALTVQLDEARRQEAIAMQREAEARALEAAANAREILAESARLAAEEERRAAVEERQRLEARLHDLEEINRRLAVIADVDEARGQLLRDLEARLTAAGIDVEVIPEQGILRFGRNVTLFPTASATPTPDGVASLRAVATALAEVLPCYSETTDPLGPIAGCDAASRAYAIESVYIEGHTDDQPIMAGGNYRDNLALSADRAATSYRILLDQAPILGRLCRTEQTTCQPILGVSGYGEHRPVADNGTPEGQGANRRIDFRIIMATPDLERLQADIDRELAP